jgi:hypothetical protein
LLVDDPAINLIQFPDKFVSGQGKRCFFSETGCTPRPVKQNLPGPPGNLQAVIREVFHRRIAWIIAYGRTAWA